MSDHDELSERQRDDIKAAMKEAIREWLDDKFAMFGKWSFASLAALGLAALLWFFLTTHGWKPPQP